MAGSVASFVSCYLRALEARWGGGGGYRGGGDAGVAVVRTDRTLQLERDLCQRE